VHLNDSLGGEILCLGLKRLVNDWHLGQQCGFVLVTEIYLHFDLAAVGLGATGLSSLHLHWAEEGASDFSRGFIVGRISLEVG